MKGSLWAWCSSCSGERWKRARMMMRWRVPHRAGCNCSHCVPPGLVWRLPPKMSSSVVSCILKGDLVSTTSASRYRLLMWKGPQYSGVRTENGHLWKCSEKGSQVIPSLPASAPSVLLPPPTFLFIPCHHHNTSYLRDTELPTCNFQRESCLWGSLRNHFTPTHFTYDYQRKREFIAVSKIAGKRERISQF